MKIIHIVRRYGPVGGMERYVWETILELAKRGHEQTVICQRCHVEKPAGITVVELGDMAIRPRWVGSLRFSHRVSAWFKMHHSQDALVHSNERVNVHQITTIHGPPFANVLKKPWWKRVSIRVAMQLFLERRELYKAQLIVPNSPSIKRQLLHYYPEYASKMTEPVLPGVVAGITRAASNVSATGGVVGFVGHEWKRKGLRLAIQIVERLRQIRPDVQLLVVGANATEIAPLFSAWEGGYKLMEWCEQPPYADIGVLLHPAAVEPYGMVISEAMAARVPVVISDVCGAAEQVHVDSGAVLSLHADVQDWVKAVDAQLSRTDLPSAYRHGWDKVAEEMEMNYRKIALKKI